MTHTELRFLETVPRRLEEISEALKRLAKNSERQPEPDRTKPYWDETRRAVFIPVVEKFLDADPLFDGKMNWQQALLAAKERSRSLPSRRDALAILLYKDEIDRLLRSHGGTPLSTGTWWTSSVIDRGDHALVLSESGLSSVNTEDRHHSRTLTAI